MSRIYARHLKRPFDITVALLALVALSPFLIVVSIFLAVYYRGNPFFIQERPGLNEKIFKLIKFKSMRDAVDGVGRNLSDEERLTTAGRILRKTSIDELPQLLNVLKGDMSLVGPRPLFVRYLPFYTARERKRHDVRPGITGLAQISGRNALRWEDRLELDVKYVETISFKTDMKILWLTLAKVARSEGVAVLPGTISRPLDEERKNAVDRNQVS